MVPKTRHKRNISQDIAGFYDWLAPEYDRMTGFEKRFVHEKPFFRLLVDRYGIRTAVDAGCGTGFHSLLLAQLGVEVTAVDVSPDMLRLLEAHAGSLGLQITSLESSFRELPLKLHAPFDTLFCLGNSLAHLLSESDLRESLRSFAAVLRTGGVLFLQLLNYDRILAKRERVQSVKEADGVTYVRFYDYEDGLIRFNILKLEGRGGRISHELNSVTLRPVLNKELLALLCEVGFEDPRIFGGISMELFDPESSKDVVVLAVNGKTSDGR
jgi:glycine/sarcosine N-methyltransferase